MEVCPHDDAPLPEDDGRGTGTKMLYDPLIGELIDGRYKVETRLGEGGLATVYAATHLLIEKRVALKVLKSEFVADAEIVERFLREAKAASRLSHVNIISLSDYGKVPRGAPFFVMELLDGRTLSDLLYEGKGLPVPEAVRIVTEIGQGLAAAHQHGVVHRDLKPDNIGLVSDVEGVEHVKILDFGLAKITHDNRKLTRVGQVLGTPEYMSPEQASGRSVDHRSDVFALGILLYRLIVGQVPFAGETFMEVISKILSERPRAPRSLCDDPELTPALEAVILGALARAPQDRFPTMDALLEALRQATSDESAAEPAAAESMASTWVDPGSPAQEPPTLEAQAVGPTEVAPQAPEDGDGDGEADLEIKLEHQAADRLVRRSAEETARRRVLIIAMVIGLVGISAGGFLAVLLSEVRRQATEDAEAPSRPTSPNTAPGPMPDASMPEAMPAPMEPISPSRPTPIRPTAPPRPMLHPRPALLPAPMPRPMWHPMLRPRPTPMPRPRPRPKPINNLGDLKDPFAAMEP
jgi:serine/threonine protein kinase